MKLIHNSSGFEVKVGDKVRSDSGNVAKIDYFRPPHSPASEGKVTVTGKVISGEFYVSVFDMKWIDREDRKDRKCPYCGSQEHADGCTNGDCHNFSPY